MELPSSDPNFNNYYCLVCDSVVVHLVGDKNSSEHGAGTGAGSQCQPDDKSDLLRVFCKYFDLSECEKENVTSISFPFCLKCRQTFLESLNSIDGELTRLQKEVEGIVAKVTLTIIDLSVRHKDDPLYVNPNPVVDLTRKNICQRELFLLYQISNNIQHFL
jgi:hypothetical protein